MCGIGGIFFSELNDFGLALSLDRISESMHQRGPDAEGREYFDYPDGRGALCHKRLKILDLSDDSAQPFKSIDARYTLVYNGEIYNFKEVRKELESAGINFTTKGDTEVLLKSWLHWGEESLTKLRGMFAFAIWDKKESELFLVRDRFGIKPLYYSVDSNRIVFSSSVRSLVASGLVKLELEKSAICDYLRWGFVNDPETPIKGVMNLSAGSILKWKSTGYTEIRKWFSPFAFEAIDKKDISFEEAGKELRSLLFSSVKEHLISDVPLGVFLSGGIDSSLMAAMATEVSNSKIHTFSLVFDEGEFDESQYSDMMAKKIRSEHHKLRVTADSCNHHFDEYLRSLDLPTMDGFNTYLISKLIRKEGIVAAVSGLGGDEIFAGYKTFALIERARKLKKVLDFSINTGLRAFPGKQAFRIKFSALLDNFFGARTVYSSARSVFLDRDIHKILSSEPILSESSFDSLSNPSQTRHLAWYEMDHYMKNQLLRDSDVFSMASSLELRVPFLDHRIFEMVQSLPEEYLYYDKSTPKPLLTLSVKDLLEKKMIYRKKQGFVLPFKSWLKKDYEEKCLLSFDDKESLDELGLDHKMVDYIFKMYKSGSEIYGEYRVLGLLSLIEWWKNIKSVA